MAAPLAVGLSSRRIKCTVAFMTFDVRVPTYLFEKPLRFCYMLFGGKKSSRSNCTTGGERSLERPSEHLMLNKLEGRKGNLVGNAWGTALFLWVPGHGICGSQKIFKLHKIRQKKSQSSERELAETYGAGKEGQSSNQFKEDLFQIIDFLEVSKKEIEHIDRQ